MVDLNFFRCKKIYLLIGIAFYSIPLWSQKVTKLHTNKYGHVWAQSPHAIKNAILEKVTIYSKEKEDSDTKIQRNGILVRHKNAKATVLICHGFMCDKFDVGMLRHLFPRGQYNLMTFDFRAHGENSQGQYSTLGKDEALDVIAAGKFLKHDPDLKGKPLFVYGFSMGAVAAIEAQAKKPIFDAMILDCPFDSSENVIKKGLENMKFSIFGYEFGVPGRSFLQKYAFHPYIQSLVKMILKTVARMDPKNIQTQIYPLSPVESIKKVDVPCFFIHCKRDERVSVEAAKTVYNGATGHKMFWLTNGRGHFDSFFYNPEKYAERVQEFFAKVISGKLQTIENGLYLEDEDDGVGLTKSS